MRQRHCRATPRRAVLVAVAMLLAAQPARADAVEDFYKGKTLRVFIGYSAGGGYDIYGRVFAEFFGRFLPGKPTVIAQNMPGAGSFVAAKFLYNVAPKDGTSFGMVSQTLPLDAAMNEDPTQFDVTKLPYVGRLLDNVDIGIGKPGSWFKTFEAVRGREIAVGATGGASPGFLTPAALVRHAGAKFKIVSGYGGSADVYLAMERGEVDLVGSVGTTFVLQRNAAWIREKTAPILYQAALKRHPLLPHVPTLGELGITPDGTQVLRTIAASAEIGRSIITTPGVPRERLAALRTAFQAMMADTDVKAAMEKRDIMMFGASAEELDEVTREVMRTPKPVLDEIRLLLKQK